MLHPSPPELGHRGTGLESKVGPKGRGGVQGLGCKNFRWLMDAPGRITTSSLPWYRPQGVLRKNQRVMSMAPTMSEPTVPLCTLFPNQ